jgi:hypothetical protein
MDELERLRDVSRARGALVRSVEVLRVFGYSDLLHDVLPCVLRRLEARPAGLV